MKITKDTIFNIVYDYNFDDNTDVLQEENGNIIVTITLANSPTSADLFIVNGFIQDIFFETYEDEIGKNVQIMDCLDLSIEKDKLIFIFDKKKIEQEEKNFTF